MKRNDVKQSVLEGHQQQIIHHQHKHRKDTLLSTLLFNLLVCAQCSGRFLLVVWCLLFAGLL